MKFKLVLTSSVSTSRISNHFSRQALGQLQFLTDLQVFNSRHLCNRGQRTSWDWRTWRTSIFQACFHDRAVNKAIKYSDYPKIQVVDNVNLGNRRGYCTRPDLISMKNSFPFLAESQKSCQTFISVWMTDYTQSRSLQIIIFIFSSTKFDCSATTEDILNIYPSLCYKISVLSKAVKGCVRNISS